MKKISMILLSVLLIASMFISCDNSTNMKDELVQVSLSAGDERSLIVSNETEGLDSVNWFYTAEKVSETQFDYGATSVEKEITLFGENKTILTLSQGKWNFELFGRKADGTLLYYGKTEGALIIKSNTPTTVAIGVSPYTTAPGTLKIENVTIKLVTANGTTTDVAPNYLKIDNDVIPNFSGSYTKTGNVEDPFVGPHTVTVAYKATDDGEDYTIAEETIVVTVYGGRTTTITGNVSEETGSGIVDGEVVIKTEDTVTKTVVANEPTLFIMNISPANNNYSEEVLNTMVLFPAGVLAEGENSLEVRVDPISSDFALGVTGNDATVGLISLKLNNAESTSFNGNVEITTYIAKQLKGVKVYFSDSVIAEDTTETDIYDPETGKLTFTTGHFSDFYVGAEDVVAYNATTKTAYIGLEDALEEYQTGTIVLLKDIRLSNVLEIGKSVTIDGNEHNIYNTAKRVIRITQPNLDVKLYNLGVVSKCTATSDVRGISFDNISSGSSLLLDGCTVSASFYAINVVNGVENIRITIKNSNVVGWAAINSYSNNSTFVVESSVLKGINDKSENSWNNYATIVFDGLGEAIGQFGINNSLTISNSSIISSSYSSNKQNWLSIQRGAQSNTITLNSTKVLDGNNNDVSGNITIVPFVGYDSEEKKYAKSYDVHSSLVIDGEEDAICYFGDMDSEALMEGGVYFPYEGCSLIQ